MLNLYVVQVRHEAFHLHADFDVWSSMSQVRSTFEMLHHFKVLTVNNVKIYNFSEYDWLSKYDFWTALGIAYISGQTWTPPLKQEDFDDITRRSTQLRSWMKQENYLVLWVTRNYKANMDLITIQIFNATEDLVVPMTYTTQSRLNFNTTRRLWQNVKSDKPKIFHFRMQDLERNDWIIFNLQQIGKY
ncbi:unnamed protein product [Lasius platythorax]|uniref:Aminopeptidase n n=2 Tax=Lasius TaxID=488720 RepID=A0A0J7K244_LASNI|nr:aminopeptidase n [Lasius niger]